MTGIITITATGAMAMFEYEFMRSAFAAAGCVALVAGPIGYFLVLRGQSFAGHALAHVGFAGATGAILLGLPPIAGMMVLTVLAGLGMGMFGERLPNRDVAIGLVLAAALGLGLLFLHFFTSSATTATALLFGNILAISPGLLRILAGLSLFCLISLGFLARPLLLASLQPEMAAAKGVHVQWLGTLFLGLVALATAAASQILGVLLVFALMVGPGATALHFSLSPMKGILLAAGLAMAESWAGLALAYLTDWPVSFWITALSLMAYFLAAAWAARTVRASHV
jgi:zinc/manganese transport system permease protein